MRCARIYLDLVVLFAPTSSLRGECFLRTTAEIAEREGFADIAALRNAHISPISALASRLLVAKPREDMRRLNGEEQVMATPETAAITDIAQGGRPSKPGKRPQAGATAGAFTAELASLARKPKTGKPDASNQASHTTANTEGTQAPKKVASDIKSSAKAAGQSVLADGKTKTKSETNVDAELPFAAPTATPTDQSNKPLDPLAAVLSAKISDGQAAAHGKPDGKASGTVPIEANTKNHAPELETGIPDGLSIASTATKGKHDAKFDELIARHQASSDAPATQPQQHQPSNTASQVAQAQVQAATQQHGSQRAETTQLQATGDASQAQTGMLLRTPEASASSNSFVAHLDAPTAARAIDQVAWTIARKSETGDRSFEIRMDPAELGRIDVKMQVSVDGKVSAVLAVERPETLDLLSRDSRALELALKDTGLDVDSGALSFSLRDQNASQAFKDDTLSAPTATDEIVETQNVSTAKQIWLGTPKSLLDIKV
jgi:hypothetical protein